MVDSTFRFKGGGEIFPALRLLDIGSLELGEAMVRIRISFFVILSRRQVRGCVEGSLAV